jgi:haloalkane dehalogenase
VTAGGATTPPICPTCGQPASEALAGPPHEWECRNEACPEFGQPVDPPRAARPRPAWVPSDLYPFQDRYVDVAGCDVHYVDEGTTGPPLLMLHGNPTWSFLYREIIVGLRDRFRCIALDYPGFGLSLPRRGYRFMPREHAEVVERFVERLDLTDVTLMVQDWGGPIGFAVATKHPERFRAFVVGNTWAWAKSDPPTQAFSRLLGGPIGRRLIVNRNLFVEMALGRGLREPLPQAAMDAYRGPFPTPGSRWPTAVFPREILASRPFLAEVEHRLDRVRDRAALIVWPTKDPAFTARERRRWEQLFRDHRTVTLEGAGHYIQEDAPDEIVAAIRDFGGAAKLAPT